MTDTVWLDIACNDPDNGLFAGRAERIECPDGLLTLEARRSPAPRIVELNGSVRLAGKAWPIWRTKTGVGNWCWNRYAMHAGTAARFLAWLHDRGFYSVDEGETRLFNTWQLERRFEAHDIEFIERQLVKAQLAAARR